ncbi:MAG: alpha/beta hydrolase [Proteobacteria bacterium]|nr:alpha/beta hydrolase [Pseudomonadota bacterium]
MSGPKLLNQPFKDIAKITLNPIYMPFHIGTHMVGRELEMALTRLQWLYDKPGIENGKLLSILNGVIGDHLAQLNSPLEIKMKFLMRIGSKTDFCDIVDIENKNIDRVVVFVHGSSLDESSWVRNGFDYGKALESELGYKPIYLRYNSGLHISQNGRELSRKIDCLAETFPNLNEIVFVGHSMGGLLAHSAALIAESQNCKWRKMLSGIITLGTPHHGAKLERAGNVVEVLLGASRFSAPFKVLGRIRSAGVTDLRYGAVLDSHWQDLEGFTFFKDPRLSRDLPENVQCFAIAGTTSSLPSSDSPGDGLVTIGSALGRHSDSKLDLGFGEFNCHIVQDTSHMDLLSNGEVLSKITEWIRSIGSVCC